MNPESERMSEKKRPNFLEELESFKRKVDFDVLKNIFRDILDRSGLEGKKVKLVEEFGVNPNDDIGAGYASGHISVSEEAYYRVDEKIRDVAMLHAIIHEEVHATTDRKFYLPNSSGYDRLDRFTQMNEAVTERLALEIAREYIDRTHFEGGLEGIKERLGTEKDKEKTLEEFFDEKFGVYQKSRAWLDEFIIALSEYAGVSQKLVWEALVRGAYHQENLKDFEDFFDEVYYPKFTQNLSRAKRPEELPTRISPRDNSLKARLVKAMLSL